MARLLDAAFEEWAAKPRDARNKRRTPRIALHDRPRVRIAFYRLGDKEFACHQTATLLDISADGMRIASSQAIPLHATVFFDLAAGSGEEQLGCATVVRCNRHDGGCDLGLRFGEDVASLDITDKLVAPESVSPIRGWTDALPKKILSAARRAFHVLSHRATSRVFLTASRDGVNAWFLVEAKLTRYCATLVVDGRKVATRVGPLLDRIGNLVSDAARPTMVRLSSHDFSGWAMIRPHAVTAHDLIAEVSTVQEAKLDSTLTDMLTAGTDRPSQVVHDHCAQTGKTRLSHRKTQSGGRAKTVAKSARG